MSSTWKSIVSKRALLDWVNDPSVFAVSRTGTITLPFLDDRKALLVGNVNNAYITFKVFKETWEEVIREILSNIEFDGDVLSAYHDYQINYEEDTKNNCHLWRMNLFVLKERLHFAIKDGSRVALRAYELIVSRLPEYDSIPSGKVSIDQHFLTVGPMFEKRDALINGQWVSMEKFLFDDEKKLAEISEAKEKRAFVFSTINLFDTADEIFIAYDGHEYEVK